MQYKKNSKFDPAVQTRMIHSYAKYLGWEVCAKRELVGSIRRRGPKRGQPTEQMWRRQLYDRTVEHCKRRAKDLLAQASALRLAAGDPKLFRLPLALRLDIRFNQRELEKAEASYVHLTRLPSATKWVLTDAEGAVRAHLVSTRVAYGLIATARYRAWEALWLDMTFESKVSRITAFAKHSGFLVSRQCDRRPHRWIEERPSVPAHWARGGLIPRAELWRFFSPENGHMVHPLCMKRVMGRAMDERGLTTDECREFMEKSNLYRGGYEVPESVAPLHRHEWTFLASVVVPERGSHSRREVRHHEPPVEAFQADRT